MSISRDVFERQRHRRFGQANPQRMELEYWEWMVRSGADPFSVRDQLGISQEIDREPDWCFERLGMTRTTMPDGRILCIAGEHEDFYDPDFCIYNDVIVLRPGRGETEVTEDSGTVEIYGYPEKDFPPTDYHSATLVGDAIFLIGRLGYSGTRIADTTPVLRLDTETYRIEALPATGRCPGWIYSHRASYDPALHAITVRGGNGYVPGSETPVPNPLTHRLHLSDLRWELFAPRDKHRHFVIRSHVRTRGYAEPTAETFRLTRVPALDPLEDAWNMGRYLLEVAAVPVTLDVAFNKVCALIEGELPPATRHQMLAEIVENLTRTTRRPWTVEEDAEEV